MLEHRETGYGTIYNAQNLQAALSSVTQLSEGLRLQLASTGPKLDVVLDGAATTVAAANKELPKLVLLIESNLQVLQI